MEFPSGPAYHMAIHFNNEDNIFGGYNNLTSSSASSVGFSSGTSSFGPHTPTSSCSTPSRNNSFNYGASFASVSDSTPFEFTPPASATSSYFGLKTADGSEYHPSGFPLTPSRSQLGYNGFLPQHYDNQMSSSQALGYYDVNNFTHQPLMATSPALATDGSASETWSQWGQADSPITFDRQTPTKLAPPISFDRRTSIKLSRGLHGLQLKELDEKFELKGHTGLRQRGREERKASLTSRRQHTRKGASIKQEPSGDGANVEILCASEHYCTFPNCNKGPYKRKEHWRRHVDGHNGELFECPFCNRAPNRSDNFRDHVKLHTKRDRKNSRVKYVPEAVPYYAALMAKIKAARKASKVLSTKGSVSSLD
ncbi:hypothetical protein QBC35DRAFT_231058 [Podospora australis]|uniref:C2H2-type domain-containing protein n=1 Tax=Podospora australis TaxID=1536484 RepID=A0AAN6WT25_9PEZI|nr:hypothetical protein QBC35DRAFT_231058 [Podospora australis]